MKNILILGVDGFIGHHLSRAILEGTDWNIFGMDMFSGRIAPVLDNPRLRFFEGDITINREWIEYHVKKADIVLPLVAIATPATYVSHPLRVFELDFEANLHIVRLCVKHGKRVVFPSSSEVYGMCRDERFDPYTSECVYGPIEKQRWIYACSKQMLDRVIYAYGAENKLEFTLFRPFNWIGPGLDNVHAAKEGSSRVITQFLGHIARGEDIRLVEGGTQRRCFTAVGDGIAALMKIIENRDGRASGKIYNIGNPANELSVRELAQLMLEVAADFDEYRAAASRVKLHDVAAAAYYGRGYQDMQHRTPDISNTTADLGWSPEVAMREALTGIFEAYRREIAAAGRLLEPQQAAG